MDHAYPHLVVISGAVYEQFQTGGHIEVDPSKSYEPEIFKIWLRNTKGVNVNELFEMGDDGFYSLRKK